MEDERETLLRKKINKKRIPSYNGLSSIHDVEVESRSFLIWVLLDQSNIWRSIVSWSIYTLLAIGVPLLSHFVFHCTDCDEKHTRPYDSIVQLSLSTFATLSFLSLSSFTRKYGLRRFLFLDRLCDVSQKVQKGYSAQVHVCSFFLSFLIILSSKFLEIHLQNQETGIHDHVNLQTFITIG